MNFKTSLQRRFFMFGFFNTLIGFIIKPNTAFAGTKTMENYKKLTNSDWEDRLSKSAYNVLRQEGTERPFSSPLNNVSRLR